LKYFVAAEELRNDRNRWEQEGGFEAHTYTRARARVHTYTHKHTRKERTKREGDSERKRNGMEKGREREG